MAAKKPLRFLLDELGDPTGIAEFQTGDSILLTSALNEAPIVTIASAATVNIGAAAANTISISGTTTITAFDTIASGALRRLHFQGALTLTHNATSLILPTAANITTAAGDVAEFVSLGSGNWRCTGYQRANGDTLGLGTAALKNTGTSGDAVPLLNAANTWTLTQTSSAGFAAGTTLAFGTGGASVAGSLYSDSNWGVVFMAKQASPAVAEFLFSNAGGTGRLQIQTDGAVRPGADNTQKLGTAANRWSEVFAGIGTINTSDARQKTPLRGMSEAEIAVAKQLAGEIGIYRFLESVKTKGADAREHIGMTVQRAIEVIQSHGLDPFRYGIVCFDSWPEQVAVYDEDGACIQPYQAAGDAFGFRHDQLMMFIAVGFEARLQALEAKL